MDPAAHRLDFRLLQFHWIRCAVPFPLRVPATPPLTLHNHNVAPEAGAPLINLRQAAKEAGAAAFPVPVGIRAQEGGSGRCVVPLIPSGNDGALRFLTSLICW